MQLGLSSYSIDPVIESGALSLLEAIDWIAEQGADCVELVPFAFTLMNDKDEPDVEKIKGVVRRANDAGIKLANYSILADLCKEDPEEYRAEVARIKRHVDVACELGVPVMRHDVCAFRRPRGENGLAYFDRLLGQIVDGAGDIADYAAARGLTTLIENHGFFANGCDRVERIIDAVDRPNYGLLLDTGNIICVDEDPSAAALRLAGRAKMIHLKDFYIRKRDPGDTTLFDCGGHWFKSMGGKFLRGSILAQGDLDIWEILGAIKASGYDGAIAIEFEGFEDPQYASRVSLDNARRIWEEV
ncbi:MAG: sugar phosphate isomerase/epimerase [Clostridiales bacterium]|nr:sugar phosphate isomerase/epimerase [Clostridiales bacterium]